MEEEISFRISLKSEGVLQFNSKLLENTNDKEFYMISESTVTYKCITTAFKT
jgi:hypothetical protein